ncbi:MAG: hypothetical protein ACK4ZW_17565 [Blastomonas sp.]
MEDSGSALTDLAAVISASAAAGATIFVLIAAWINARTARANARLQARISQRIKRAEFRQGWINSLREAFIEFQKTTFARRADSAEELVEQAARIMLLMNRSDPQFEELRKCMGQQLDGMTAKGRASRSTNDDFIKISQSILKREWEVTKNELEEIENI